MIAFSSFLKPILSIFPDKFKDYFGNANRERMKDMSTEEIVRDITSRDPSRVWSSACQIADLCQIRERILPLIPYLSEIQTKTVGLELGGAFAPNQRFINFAIKTLQFYRDGDECPCNLYRELDSFDPAAEKEKGNITILDLVSEDGRYVDYYSVRCNKCRQVYKIIERDYHYTWWGWTKQELDS